MVISVSNKTIKKTAKCEKDFDCLKKNNSYCEIDFDLTDGVLILKCEESSYCSYKKQFDDKKFVCTCPTRNEIFKKYNF